ncbi:MAG: DUF5312 family protein [Spirochaetia bacterium]
MQERSVLPDLARSLTDGERRRLLDKVRRSVTLIESTAENIYQKEMDEEERETIVRNDLNRASLILRFRLWLRRLFTGKEETEIYLNLKLKSLKRAIQQRNSELAGLDTKSIYPGFAEEVFAVYTRLFPLIPLFRHLWKSKDRFEALILDLVGNRVEEPKRELTDFLTIEEMQNIYERTGTKKSIHEQLVRELERYCESIPDDHFGNLEKGIKPVYYLKDFVLFPYQNFFKLFQFTPDEDTEEPNFRSASVRLALPYLEQLYYAVYAASKIEDPVSLDQDFAEMLCDSGEDFTGEAPCGKIESGDVDGTVRGVVREIRNFQGKVPLVEMIRYFHEDPYYQLVFYVPKLYLRDFFVSKLKLMLLPKLDEIFDDVRRQVIDKQIKELFPNTSQEPLLYYRDYMSLDYNKLGIPTFSYTKSINLLYNFIRIVYRRQIQEIIQILSQGVLRQNRITLNRLLVHIATLEDLETKIRILDESLSPDEEDGKLFTRIRYTLATDATHQRLYRSLINQKDSEVKGLIEGGKEALLGLKKMFDEFITSPMESFKQKLRSYHYIDGRSQKLIDVLQDRADKIEKFQNLLYEISRIERGV